MITEPKGEERIELTICPTAVGPVAVAASCRGVVGTALPGSPTEQIVAACARRFPRLCLARVAEPTPWLEPGAEALRAHFEGGVPELPALDLDASDFERSVWMAIRDIPPGRTSSYRDIAEAIGQPAASRAVGQACRANPVPILVPCHRVVGARGKLVGFGGGLDLKARLLAHEGALLT